MYKMMIQCITENYLPIIKVLQDAMPDARKASDFFAVTGVFCVYCNSAKIKWNLPMFHAYESDKGAKFNVTDDELERFLKHFDIFVKLASCDDPVAQDMYLDELNNYELRRQYDR